MMPCWPAFRTRRKSNSSATASTTKSTSSLKSRCGRNMTTTFVELQDRARRAGVICYTAYNHRFEPHYLRMRELIASGELGRIYSCRMYYGNGTARLVRDSVWRDHGAGVLPDLGSHLLDTCRYWFGDIGDDFSVISARAFEN